VGRGSFVDGILLRTRSFRARNLDDAISRRHEGHTGNDGGNVVRRDRLEQAGRKPGAAMAQEPKSLSHKP